jgi:hypothetical protein
MDTQDNINELITAYVDGELSKAEEQQLRRQAAENPQIQQAIDAERQLKKLLQVRLHREQAPERLRNQINNIIASADQQAQEPDRNFRNQRLDTDQPSSTRNRFLLSMAAVLAIGLFIAFAFRYTGSLSSSDTGAETASILPVENLTEKHYAQHSGARVPASFEAASPAQAEQRLLDEYGLDITVPELSGARFAGVSYTDFYEGFFAPLLTYQVGADENSEDFIYIFAFENESLEGQQKLTALSEARDAIIAHDDVFVHRVNNHEVVSWQWHDVWYTAVSNHDGDIVASMLPH